MQRTRASQVYSQQQDLTAKLGALAFLALQAPLRLLQIANFRPDEWQRDVIINRHKRLLLNCTRQGGKSHTIAALAAMVALQVNNGLVLIVSGSKDQAKNTFIYLSRILSDLHVPLVEDTKLSCILANGSRVIILAPHAGRVRSYAAPDMIIMDEAAWIQDDVFRAIEPMMATKPGCILAYASTPNGKVGEFYQAWTGGGNEEALVGENWRRIQDSWYRIRVTWEDCPRITRDFVEDVRLRRGNRYVGQEYECDFVEAEDQFFTNADIAALWSDEVPDVFEGASTTLADMEGIGLTKR